MLRQVLIPVCCGILLPFSALVGVSDVRAVPADTTGVPASEDPARQDAWYRRGFNALFAHRQPDEDGALTVDPSLVRERFLPYAGRRIREVRILGRGAFGTVDAEGLVPLSWARIDSLVTRTNPLERTLNALATSTRQTVIRNFLLFREGEEVIPAELADSERLLRRQAHIRDALILVEPLADRPDLVDVVVLVRDRWPWGVQASVKNPDQQQMAIFHRNAGGFGLNLELELHTDRARQPSTGWSSGAGAINVAGTFVDVSLSTWRAWDGDRTVISALRGFSYPDIRLLGGWSIVNETWKAGPLLPPDRVLSGRSQDVWLGWNVHLRSSRRHDKRRLRLVPALRWQQVEYRESPRKFTLGEHARADRRRYLLQVCLSGLDHYTTGLVYGYGETEDIPVGFWAALVAGMEYSAGAQRFYHGIRTVWPSFLSGKRYLVLEAALGGFRRVGRFEDGVLDLGVTTFSPMQERRYGAWRHFLQLRYTLGIDPEDPLGLRLDAAALRDLDDPVVSGNQRLVAQMESVLFTKLSVSGFKITVFGYAGCGQVALQREPILSRRLFANAGAGLRLNNPGLVLPTIEMRLGALHARDGWQPAVTVRMGEVNFVQRRMPGVEPSLLPYR